MAATPVLIDGYQFLKSTGTGIASYVRTLASLLKTNGCSVSILYGQRFRPNAKTSQGASAAAVFSREVAAHSRLQNIRENIGLFAGLATGGARRARPISIDAKGLDLRAVEPQLPLVDQILNADRLFARSHKAFHFSGKFTEVPKSVGDQSFAVAHWTAPIPVRMRGVQNIYTIHDLIPLQFPYTVIGYGDRTFKLHEIIGREADHIITVSEASKRHIVELMGVPEERVSVTYQPVPSLPDIDRADAERLVEMIYGVKAGQYSLFLGALEPKKNVKRLVESYLLAGVDCPLLLAGPLGWLYDEDLELINLVNRAQQAASMRAAETPLQALAALGGATSQVRQLGFLPRRHVVALLKCAKFFVFPSIYEGFGLPVIEAMQLGVPVLTSDTSSLPEVAGDAAITCDPFNVADMARAIRRIDGDGDLRAELSRRGPAQAAKFSPEYCGALLAEAYAKIGVEFTRPGVIADPKRALNVSSPSLSSKQLAGAEASNSAKAA